jgi:chromate transport protein ChrA
LQPDPALDIDSVAYEVSSTVRIVINVHACMHLIVPQLLAEQSMRIFQENKIQNATASITDIFSNILAIIWKKKFQIIPQLILLLDVGQLRT